MIPILTTVHVPDYGRLKLYNLNAVITKYIMDRVGDGVLGISNSKTRSGFELCLWGRRCVEGPTHDCNDHRPCTPTTEDTAENFKCNFYSAK